MIFKYRILIFYLISPKVPHDFVIIVAARLSFADQQKLIVRVTLLYAFQINQQEFTSQRYS